MITKQEVFISVDVETAGPIPGEFSMLTLGACLVHDPSKTFSCSFRPINDNFIPEALEVTGLSLEKLAKDGLSPRDAMQNFAVWIDLQCTQQELPVFVGLNAPFDWSFVNYYFHRFTGANPFGFTAVDIKAVYMGATGSSWQDTRSSAMARRLNPTLQGDHDALHDALYQAELFRLARNLTRS
ncbi:UNVERIFIED_ORG: DNA polymerase III epsilon subunit-like protein [Paraburkholderia sediminicola]|jgi:ribonuclease T|nr:DNA polymerase III epsilon subunit-like protein [Paraburkholderia sediminicola]